MNYLPYITTEAFCCIFSVTLLLRLKSGLGLKHEIRTLRAILLLYIVMLVTDIFWALAEANIHIPSYYINAFINAVSITATALGCYCWFRFVGGRLDSIYTTKKALRVLFNVPIIVICVLNMTSVFTSWVFFINSAGHYDYGPLFPLQEIITFFYLLVPTVDSLVHAVKTPVKSQRSEYIAYAAYIAIPMTGVFFQDYIPNVPVFALSVLVVIQVLFLTIYVDREKELVQQEKELTKSRTSIMLSQIQPHFLYNSLAVIQDMCHGKAPEAENATIEFARFLRGNLDSLSQSSPIPFSQELAHTENYLSLERKRFGEDILRTEFDISAVGFSIPALTLQPIVENAVRYGIMQRENGGTVNISSQETDSSFVVTVQDDGVGFDVMTPKADGRTHIGIENVRSRLFEMCGGTLDITSTAGQGTKAVITIPKKA